MTKKTVNQKRTLIYGQPNWPDEFQQILCVEVQEFKGGLPIWAHKDRLRDRYRKLAEVAISQGKHPDQWIKDFLETFIPREGDPTEIADSLVNSQEFHYVLMSRDEPRETSMVDQKMLRGIYDGTGLDQIIRLLRELYLNSISTES